MAKSLGAFDAEVRSKVTLAMFVAMLRAPIKIAEPSCAVVLLPFSVKSPSSVLLASKILISPVKAPKKSAEICAPTAATGVAKVMVMSGPWEFVHNSGVPGAKLPFHGLEVLLSSSRSKTAPSELTVAFRPLLECTLSVPVSAVKAGPS